MVARNGLAAMRVFIERIAVDAAGDPAVTFHFDVTACREAYGALARLEYPRAPRLDGGPRAYRVRLSRDAPPPGAIKIAQRDPVALYRLGPPLGVSHPFPDR